MTKSELSKIIYDLKIGGDTNRLINESYDEFMDALPISDYGKKFRYYMEQARNITPLYIKTLVKSLLMMQNRCMYCLSPLWIEENKSDNPYECKSCNKKRIEYYSGVPKLEVKKKISQDDPLIKTLKKIRDRLELDNEVNF